MTDGSLFSDSTLQHDKAVIIDFYSFVYFMGLIWKRGQSYDKLATSFSHAMQFELALVAVDSCTYLVHEVLERITSPEKENLKDFCNFCLHFSRFDA